MVFILLFVRKLVKREEKEFYDIYDEIKNSLKNTMEISIGKLEIKTSYLHKIDINEYEAYDVGIGDREIVICPQFFSPACYLYIILLLQALPV